MNIGRLFGREQSGGEAENRPDGSPRLPPGQYLTKKWPVLTYEPTPTFDAANYRFRVGGEVEQPLELTWEELQALPRVSLKTDIHCVTTWSRYDNDWEGVHIREILARVKPKPNAQFVMAHSYTGYTTNLPLSALDNDDVIIAFRHNGADLETEHGGPVRLVVPKLYFYKSAKWFDGLDFMEKDRPGFWEVRGYSNSALPWDEDRYW